MIDVIIGAVISFFAAFGFVELVKYIHSEFHRNYNSYQIVVTVKNGQDKIEGIIRNIILNSNVLDIIIVDLGSTDKTIEILERLCVRYPFIKVVNRMEYIDLINNKGC